MKGFKRIVAFLVALSVIFTVPMLGVCAEGTENVDPKDIATVVEAVIEHLTIYSRYDDVYGEKLYKEALLSAIEKNPEIYEDVMEAMLSSIDENSEYYNAGDSALFKEDITGIIVGIGITFQVCVDGVEVVGVIPDMPAADAGVQVGDVIVSVNGVSLVGMNSETASSYIRGEEGSAARLGIKRQGEDSTLYLDAVREKITGTSVKGVINEEGKDKVMYIRVYGFISNTADCFKAELDRAKVEGVTNLVIDLRDNGGGLFDQAITMADYILPKGSLITTEDHKIDLIDKKYYAEAEDEQEYQTVILINENTASSSEVFTAALSENDCAYIIGEKSYGKGTIQTIKDLPFGDSMKYTVGYYLTPEGNNIHHKGILPDMKVENTTTDFDMTPYPEFGYYQVYKEGDAGAEVKMTKELLENWGSFDGEINEEYDGDLTNAVYKFQAQTGLYPYGELDYTTQHELYERMKMSKVVNDDQLDAAFKYFDKSNKE